MSSAYKCDRCGKFYSENPIDPKECILDSHRIRILRYGTRIFDDGPHDLCDDCVKNFISWWKDPWLR